MTLPPGRSPDVARSKLWLSRTIEPRALPDALGFLAPLALGLFLSRLYKVVSVALVIVEINGDSVRKRVLQAAASITLVGLLIAARGPAARVLAKYGIKLRTAGAGLVGLIA